MMVRRTTYAGYLMALVILVDQLTKYWMMNNVTREHPRIYVTSFLNFVLVANKGITFGLLNQMTPKAMPVILSLAALGIFLLLGRWLLRTNSTLIALSLAAIMGGAVGNVIDRIRFGAVVDFLDFHYHDMPWYAFNIADACIVTGVIFLVFDSLVRGR